MNTGKSKLAAGELTLCVGLRQARTVDVAMIADQAGFDFIYVDMEHCPISLETTSAICAGCFGLNITPLVRVPGLDADWISRVLDGGAQGVIVPHVSTRAQAEHIVSAARFPPVGRRSVMGPTPALGYKTMPLGQTNAFLNAQTLLIAMIETPEGVECADEIASVEGIDVLLIGSNDLCTEMGIPGELRHPRLRDAYVKVAQACKAHGKTLGVGGIRGDTELQHDLVELGARFVIAGNDVGYLMGAMRKDAAALRALDAA